MNVSARFPRMISLVIVLLVMLPLSSSLSASAQSRSFTAGQVKQYPLPDGHTPFGSIAKGPDGDLWFLEYPANNVGKMTTKGVFTEYPIPTGTSRPVGITAGPDGNMWFTEWWGNNIGKITTSGKITEYPLPTPNAYPADITLGPDGNLWFTEYYGESIGKITPQGQITQYRLPHGGGPVWDHGWPGRQPLVHRVCRSQDRENHAHGQITEYRIHYQQRACTKGHVSNPYGITAGPDGKIWFTITGFIGCIGKMTLHGQFTTYPLTQPDDPQGITTGPDGNLWFTEQAGGDRAHVPSRGIDRVFLRWHQS